MNFLQNFFTLNFTSLYFFAALAAIVLLYYVAPKKLRWLVLLFSNAAFVFAAGGAKCLFVMAAMFFVAWVSSHLFEVFCERPAIKKQVLIFAIFFNAGLLVLMKDAIFFANLFRVSKEALRVPLLQSLAPAGMSYWTLTLISYLLDCYWNSAKAEKNFLKFAAFAGFFPLLVSGPIIRNSDAKKILAENDFRYENLCFGAQRILWGVFKKLVIAERLSVIVSAIFEGGTKSQMGTAEFSGLYILLGAAAFVFELYADFSSYMDIALGAAQMFGISLPENFSTPFYSKTTSEFWKRWHATLGAFLCDYVYIPLGGNRKGKLRKYFNIMIVFLISGFWHGGSFRFLAWGFLFGMWQVLGDATLLQRKRLCEKLGISRECFSFELWQRLCVFFAGVPAWIFFRASSFKKGAAIFFAMFKKWNPWIFFDGSLFRLGLDAKDFFVLIFAMMILAAVSKMQRAGFAREAVAKQNAAFRWTLWILLFVCTLLFGMYGEGYNASEFIYRGF